MSTYSTWGGKFWHEHFFHMLKEDSPPNWFIFHSINYHLLPFWNLIKNESVFCSNCYLYEGKSESKNCWNYIVKTTGRRTTVWDHAHIWDDWQLAVWSIPSFNWMAGSNEVRLMDIPLRNCTIEEPHVSALSVDKGSQTCRNPLIDVGSVCNTYYDEWVEHFKVGKTNIKNKSWSGHLSMLLTEEYIQRVDALISEDGWIMLEPVMATVSISYGFAQDHSACWLGVL